MQEKSNKRRAGVTRAFALLASVATALTLLVGGATPAHAAANPAGIDVSSHQGNVNWTSVKNAGYQFAFVKATEGVSYKNPYFAQQYTGSYYAGIIRGAYHFALPNVASGAAQANYLVNNGGGWSADNLTLPAVLDIEWNPYGSTCYGLSQQGMVNWISDFVNTYKSRTGRDPIIYTAASWWNQCTGGSNAFASRTPLWVAHYGVSSPAIPGGFGWYSFWQYSSSGSVPGVAGPCDMNVWNGSRDRLLALANNTP